VDLHFSRGNEVKVYVDANNFAFSVTFNQSDVSKNINKFYIMQILQLLSSGDQYFIFTRWGRVGLVGNKAEAGPISLAEALDNYREKLREKFEHGYKKI
jgi:poly [ADP-ribose] polymerase 2/3/4